MKRSCGRDRGYQKLIPLPNIEGWRFELAEGFRKN